MLALDRMKAVSAPINPNKPLPNPKHEIFAQNFVKANANGTVAYKSTYGIVDSDVAGASAARLLANDCIRQRVRVLLDSSKANLKEIIGRKIPQWLEAKRPIITVNGVEGYTEDTSNQIEAGKVALKLYGAMQSENSVNIDARQVHNTTINNNIGELSLITDKIVNLNKALGIADEPDGVVNAEE